MNILLTSVGRRGYLVQYFKDALGTKGKVFVSNSSKLSPALSNADDYVVTPLIYDENYIAFLLKYCKEKNIQMIVSLFDIDLYILANSKQIFEENGISLIVSDKEFIEICNDKWLTYNYLLNNNISTPQTYLSINSVLKAIKSNSVSFPLIVKPRWGMGSLEIFTADNEEELILFYDKVKRNIKVSYLEYESNKDIDNSVIIQEKIIGTEFGMDVINDLKGNYVNTIIRKKIAMRAGETDCAIIVENLIIKDISRKIAKISRHIGNLDVDILERNSKYYVLEMNARFGGGYPFSHLAGVNLPLALIKWQNNELIEKNILEAEIGVIGQKDISIVKLDNNL